MQSTPIYLSDLILLRDVFAPNKMELAIFDPFHRLTGVFKSNFRLLQEPLVEENNSAFYIDLAIDHNSFQNTENALCLESSINIKC